MKRKYTSYVMLGVLATFVLLLSVSPTMASGTLLINSNPSGAAVSIANTGQNLGTTPYYIDPTAYPSPTYLRLTKSGYESINTAIYKWMVPPTYTSLSFNLKPLSTTTTIAKVPASTPAPTPAPTAAPTSGMTIDSSPSGANVYVLYGPNDGKYLGRTPFIYDPSIGTTYIKFVKPGYLDSKILVYSWMPRYSNIIVAILTPV